MVEDQTELKEQDLTVLSTQPSEALLAAIQASNHSQVMSERRKSRWLWKGSHQILMWTFAEAD